MTGTNYELKIRDYFTRMLLQEAGYPVNIKHNEVIRGRSGTSHQIDLSYQFSIARFNYLTIIECKCWNRKVSQNIISQVNDVKNDVNAQKAIVVSALGFQSGALRYAEHVGIGLVKITEKLEETRHLNFNTYPGSNHMEWLLQKDGDAAIMEQKDAGCIGLINPDKSIDAFFSEQYSPSVLKMVRRFESERAEQVQQEMSNTLQDAVLNIPADWYKPYVQLETAGLGLHLYNEGEINKLKGLVSVARMMAKEKD
jgi:hypothetical protein